MRCRSYWVLFNILAVFFGAIFAQTGREKISTDTLQTKSGSGSVVGYPIVFYTPETDAALGGMVSLYITKPYRHRVSKIRISGWYSRTHQYSIAVLPSIYFPG